MTEEIKEILNTFKELTEDYSASSLLDFEEYEIPCIQLKMVLDYITNLQQENEKLKEELKNRPIVDFTYDVYKELEDYKSRCEKAIEYIMSNLITEWDIKNDGCVSGSDLSADAITPILNILNGSDENV